MSQRTQRSFGTVDPRIQGAQLRTSMESPCRWGASAAGRAGGQAMTRRPPSYMAARSCRAGNPMMPNLML
eukprot:scaffold281636_cov35-Tisochrysis_lutea.AAC.5